MELSPISTVFLHIRGEMASVNAASSRKDADVLSPVPASRFLSWNYGLNKNAGLKFPGLGGLWHRSTTKSTSEGGVQMLWVTMVHVH